MNMGGRRTPTYRWPERGELLGVDAGVFTELHVLLDRVLDHWMGGCKAAIR